VTSASDWTVLTPHIAERRVDLVARCQQGLRATTFSSRAEIRPAMLKRLAEAEAGELLDFLRGRNAGRVRQHGGELCRAGLAALL
jgi:hypothetical protein